MRSSATVTCRLSARRSVGVGGLLRKNSPAAPGLVRPSQVVIVTLAGRLNAIQTETRVGSTRRRTGPASTSGNVITSPLLGRQRDALGAFCRRSRLEDRRDVLGTDTRRRSHLRHEMRGVDGGGEMGAEGLDHPAIGDGRLEYGELRIGHCTPAT